MNPMTDNTAEACPNHDSGIFLAHSNSIHYFTEL